MAAVCVSGWLLAMEALAQSIAQGEPDTYWSADFSGSGVISPGIGSSVTAAGWSGSIALVRSRDAPAQARTTCVGARVTFAQQWSNFGSTDGIRREQWLVAGPVLEMHHTFEGGFACRGTDSCCRLASTSAGGCADSRTADQKSPPAASFSSNSHRSGQSTTSHRDT
jgi:hypothetical protein